MSASQWHSRPSAQIVKAEDNDSNEAPPWRGARSRKHEENSSMEPAEVAPWKTSKPRKRAQQEAEPMKEELQVNGEQPLKKKKLLPKPTMNSKEKLLAQLAAAEEEEKAAALHKEKLMSELVERRNRDRAVEEQKQKLLQDLEEIKKSEEEERARERARKRAEEVQAKVRERRKKAKEEEEERERKRLEEEVARLSQLEEEFDRQNEESFEAPADVQEESAAGTASDRHVYSPSSSSAAAHDWNQAPVPHDSSWPAHNSRQDIPQEHMSSASWPAPSMQHRLQENASAPWPASNLQSVKQELNSWAAENMQQDSVAHSTRLLPPPPSARARMVPPRPLARGRVMPPAPTPWVAPEPPSGTVIHGLIRQTVHAAANANSNQGPREPGVHWQGSHVTSPAVGWSGAPANVDNERSDIIRDVRSYLSASSPSASSWHQAWEGDRWETIKSPAPEPPEDASMMIETSQEVETCHFEESSPVTSWRVLPPRVTVRQIQDLQRGKPLGTKTKGTCIKGIKDGEWLALTEETGYILIERGKIKLLERIEDASEAGRLGDIEAVETSADEEAKMKLGKVEAVESVAGDPATKERYIGIVKDFFANAVFAIINSSAVFDKFRKAVFVTKPELDVLRPGQKVSFHVEMNKGRLQAVDIEQVCDNEQGFGPRPDETDFATDSSAGNSPADAESPYSSGKKGHGKMQHAADTRYTGKVRPFTARSSFVFITSPEILETFGRDVFATKPEMDLLKPNQVVSFRVEVKLGRPKALDVQSVDSPVEESGQLVLLQDVQSQDEEGFKSNVTATDVRYTGMIKPFAARGSFAFITSPEILDTFGKEVFVNLTPQLASLTPGQDVSFRVEMKRGRPHACDLEDSWGNELGPASAEIDNQQEQYEASSSSSGILSLQDSEAAAPGMSDSVSASAEQLKLVQAEQRRSVISWKVNEYSVVIREKKDRRFAKTIGCKTKGTCVKGWKERDSEGGVWIALTDKRGYILISGDNVLPIDGSDSKVDAQWTPRGITHDEGLRYNGVVKDISLKGSFGWITSNEIRDSFGRDAFVCPPELHLLKPGQHVSFRVEIKLGRPRALDIKHIGENSRNNGAHFTGGAFPPASAREAAADVVQPKGKGHGKDNQEKNTRYAGTVKPFNERSSFALITSNTSNQILQVFGKDVFVVGKDLKGLAPGQEVTFRVVMSRNRPQAVDIIRDLKSHALLQLAKVYEDDTPEAVESEAGLEGESEDFKEEDWGAWNLLQPSEP